MEITERKSQFIELRVKGYSYDKIAKQMKLSKQTLVEWGKQCAAQIESGKRLELDSIASQFALHREERLKSLGSLLQRLEEEIATRDLTEVPTDKLLAMYLKFHSNVTSELVELSVQSSEEIETSLEEEKPRLTVEFVEPDGSRRLEYVDNKTGKRLYYKAAAPDGTSKVVRYQQAGTDGLEPITGVTIFPPNYTPIEE